MNYLITRQQLEQEELQRLASYAMRNIESKGREFDEKKDKYRLDFQRDRDRVLHCKSFRRLKGKTQVFVSHHGDHFRSRLTHTLEVAQIARSLACNLRANEYLAETIALAHDLGHTPFGHAGEDAMNECMIKFGMGFEHNAQSRRVVEKLEKKLPNFDGLNLTYETREGLWKHRTPYDQDNFQLSEQAFLEAQIVDLADQIAYQNHDLDDGLRSGLLRFEDLTELEIIKIAIEKITNYELLINNYKNKSLVGALIHIMVQDALIQTAENLKNLNPKLPDDIREAHEKMVSFSPKIKKANAELRQILFSRLYEHEMVIEQMNKGKNIVKKVFDYYLKNPNEMPGQFQEALQKGEKVYIVVKDFVAGMTDDFALKELGKIQD